MKKCMALVALTAAVVCLETSLSAAVRLAIPSQDPGPPFYASIARPPGGQIFQDGEWAAIPFLRETSCVLADSNLLDGFDPRAFGCRLTVHGFAIYKTARFRSTRCLSTRCSWVMERFKSGSCAGLSCRRPSQTAS
jgi:hypothetical protein